MKILLAGGGTAGHINPALAIAGFVKDKEPSSEILFVGTKKGMESTLVPQSGYSIKYVEVEGLSKKLNFKNIKSLIHMITAKGKCKKIIKEVFDMNRFIVLFLLILTALCTLVSCDNGKCDKCNAPSVKTSAETKRVLGVDGEYCRECFEEESEKALKALLS